MKTITIQIKNMVCPRCIHVVKQILRDLNISFTEVDLGYATLNIDPFPDFDLINEKLEALDLGLICDQNELLITEINKAIHCYMENISWIGHRKKLSDYISKEVARNYHQLSKVYSRYSGITIEQYFIDLRTNKVKELIRQGKLNLSQIAITVGYSGIHYLSGQFRKYTGLSLSEYKRKLEEESGKSAGKEDQAVIRRLIPMRPGYEVSSRSNGDRRFNTPGDYQDYKVHVSV
ncbi:AraC family transcriptional regulator [Imperialibacter roseus]|uniref:AraC family transcriptional regulator n=1 Tax=Imperialibacter roseus TaxID=1324217 RepID=A0ABZ0IUF9_9BACT|nr:AraC family transcriptional regulator [Imperialibacter roseus]WOK07252.1 AraC family transcriptional regulator [Imperialibacter roseus]